MYKEYNTWKIILEESHNFRQATNNENMTPKNIRGPHSQLPRVDQSADAGGRSYNIIIIESKCHLSSTKRVIQFSDEVIRLTNWADRLPWNH